MREKIDAGLQIGGGGLEWRVMAWKAKKEMGKALSKPAAVPIDASKNRAAVLRLMNLAA